MMDAALRDLQRHILRARGLHPEGTGLRDVSEEYLEVMSAETPERLREELLDLAVVAMRMYMGDTK